MGIIPADLPAAATLNICELENVVEILDRPAVLFHYLDRRAEIETNNDLIANEISLLSLYLATGFDLGDIEGGETKALALPAMDSDLEPYFMGKEIGRIPPKPKRRFTAWWNDMLRMLEERASFGWMANSYGLLCLSHDRQKAFERGVKKMLKQVKGKWWDPKHQNVCYLLTGSPSRRLARMCVGVKNTAMEKQRETVERAFSAVESHEQAWATIAIVRSAASKASPYSAIYFIRRQEDST